MAILAIIRIIVTWLKFCRLIITIITILAWDISIVETFFSNMKDILSNMEEFYSYKEKSVGHFYI